MNKVSSVTLSHRPDRNTHDVTGHADLAQVHCLHHFPGHQHEQRSQQQLERARGQFITKTALYKEPAILNMCMLIIIPGQ